MQTLPRKTISFVLAAIPLKGRFRLIANKLASKHPCGATRAELEDAASLDPAINPKTSLRVYICLLRKKLRDYHITIEYDHEALVWRYQPLKSGVDNAFY